MKQISKILIVIAVLLSITACEAKIKNSKTTTVKIYGNCGMCKKVIEKAGNLKGIAKVDWNIDSKLAVFVFDSKQTNPDEILKRIALSGYDSDAFLAPVDAYTKLPNCCHYERTAKGAMPTMAMADLKSNASSVPAATTTEEIQKNDELASVFDTYFSVKDALVSSNGNQASEKAKQMLSAIKSVKMEKLDMKVHMVWMKVLKNLTEDAEHISETKDPKHQRDYFITLSQNVYQLMKVSKQAAPVYFQHCPMANGGKGADWLSKESAIKNPYYGSMMLTCGKVIETIK